MGYSSSTPRMAPEDGVASASKFPANLDSKELDLLQQQVGQRSFTGLRHCLAKTRQSRDWQDRYFVLDVVAPAILPGSLDSLCAAEPNAADLALIRGAHLFDMVAKSRGTKTADRTTDQQIAQAQNYVKSTIASLRQAIQLDPADPTPHVFAMRCFQVFSDLHTHLQQAYQQALQLAPDFVPVHFAMVNAQAEKWGGSHERSLQVARHAISKAQPGSDAAACLFLAHILVWQHAILFAKDQKRAKAYTADRNSNQELNEAFDRWISPPYQAQRSSVPYLHHAAYWYFQAGDRVRLQQVLTTTAGKTWDKAWVFAGDAKKTYAAALEFAATGTVNSSQAAKKGGLFGWFK